MASHKNQSSFLFNSSADGQKGNVLFLILIAVALFAALSYAVTSSSRSSGGDASSETTRAAASAMLQYAGSIRTSVQRMQITNQVPTPNIDFLTTSTVLENDSPGATYDNTNCNDPSCQVFASTGGAAVYQAFTQNRTKNMTGFGAAWTKPGHWEFMISRVQDIGSNLPEVMMRTIGIDIPVCNAINQILGLPDSPNYGFAGSSAPAYSGNPTTGLANTTNPVTYGATNNDLKGRTEFCVRSGAWADFYVVLVER